MLSLMCALICMASVAESAHTKIAYKKPLHGKDKRLKFKTPAECDCSGTTSVSSTTTTEANNNSESTNMEKSAQWTTETNSFNSTTDENVKEKREETTTITSANVEIFKSSLDEPPFIEEVDNMLKDLPEVTITSTTTTTTTSTAAPQIHNTTAAVNTVDNTPIPCTCGIFLASQIKNRNSPPEGTPVIVNELDRSYTCSIIGQKQCQTKCLETVS